jgi:hypothetical protein
MSSRRSASVSRTSSSTRISSKVSGISNNSLATVHSPEVNRTVTHSSADQSRFPLLSASLDNNVATTNITDNTPPLLTDGSPGVAVSSHPTTIPSFSIPSSSDDVNSNVRDHFSSPLPYNPNSNFVSSSSSSSSSNSNYNSSSKSEVVSAMSPDQFNQILQLLTSQHEQRMLVMEKELSHLRTENISLKMTHQNSSSSHRGFSAENPQQSISNRTSQLDHSPPKSRSRSRKSKQLNRSDDIMHLQNNDVYVKNIDENLFSSYNAFLQCRENYFPLSEFPYLYDRGYSLLSKRGRVFEYLRFMIVTGCTELLYPLITKRWYDYFQYYMGIKPATSSRLDVVDHNQVKIPLLIYDDRDIIQHVRNDYESELPSNSYTLSCASSSLHAGTRRPPTLIHSVWDIVIVLSNEYKDLLSQDQSYHTGSSSRKHNDSVSVKSEHNDFDIASNLSRMKLHDAHHVTTPSATQTRVDIHSFNNNVPSSSHVAHTVSRGSSIPEHFQYTADNPRKVRIDQSNYNSSSSSLSSDYKFDEIFPQIVSLFGQNLQPSIQLAVNQSNWTETKKAKEYEEVWWKRR